MFTITKTTSTELKEVYTVERQNYGDIYYTDYETLEEAKSAFDRMHLSGSGKVFLYKRTFIDYKGCR